mmetsp:Transcript_20690/g.57152  ORF Transcript_20690/g.57152 Transcript_20690/m.57152 type:complete len:298 (+) Transcript_20690:2473-3366(+)
MAPLASSPAGDSLSSSFSGLLRPDRLWRGAGAVAGAGLLSSSSLLSSLPDSFRWLGVRINISSSPVAVRCTPLLGGAGIAPLFSSPSSFPGRRRPDLFWRGAASTLASGFLSSSLLSLSIDILWWLGARTNISSSPVAVLWTPLLGGGGIAPPSADAEASSFPGRRRPERFCRGAASTLASGFLSSSLLLSEEAFWVGARTNISSSPVAVLCTPLLGGGGIAPPSVDAEVSSFPGRRRPERFCRGAVGAASAAGFLSSFLSLSSSSSRSSIFKFRPLNDFLIPGPRTNISSSPVAVR